MGGNDAKTSDQPAEERYSCSGIILSDQPAVVLCWGQMFSRFLNNKYTLSHSFQFLLRESFSSDLQIYVQQSTQAKDVSYEEVNCNKARDTPAPLKAELLMLINCLEFQSTFLKLFNEADNWGFYSGTEDADIIKNCGFLSCFAVLTVPGLVKSMRMGPVFWVSSCTLEKGCEVYSCGSPFGSMCPDLFMNSLTKGIVSNLSGQDHAIILTDARCLPGTEGGGLFVRKGDDAYLVGLIACPLCWKSGELIGLSLACSFHLILRNIVQVLNHRHSQKLPAELIINANPVLPCTNVCTTRHNLPVVSLVDSGHFWGSGIVLNHQMILTCRHILNGKSSLRVRYRAKERLCSVMGDVLFATNISSPFDVAVVKLKENLHGVFVPTLASCYNPGEDVYVIGYGVFGDRCGHTVTSGVLSRVVTCQSQPVMLQSTCAVQAGTSGGALVRARTGELLGLVCSNTRDLAANVTYPHLNFSVPVSVLEPLLRDYSLTGDVTVFQQLDDAGLDVAKVWWLQNKPRKPPMSKL